MEDIDARSEGTNESIPRMRLRSNLNAIDENKKDEKILNKTELLFKKMKGKMLRELQKGEETKEWERYLNCNQLPYPELPPSVHQHFVTWCHETKFATLRQLDASLTLYLPTFDAIKLLTDFPIKIKANVVISLRETMQNWKCEFTEKIDYACFTMIKEIRKYFTHIDYYRRNYQESFENFELGMWALLDVPFSSTCPFNRHTVYFPNMNATVTLPLSYNCKPIVLRVMYTPFDFQSDLSASRYQPEIKSNDLSNEIKKCETLMESLDLSAIPKEKEIIRKSGKQQTLSERQLSFLKNYRSHTPSSFIHSQDNRSIHSSNNFFQQRIKLMKRHARDISNGTSIRYDHFDKHRGFHSPWDARHLGGYRSSGESLLSSVTTFTCTAKSSVIHRIFSFGSSMLDPFSNDEMDNEEKGEKQCEWNYSDWEIFAAGEVDLEDNTSFLDLIFHFEESNTYMNLVGILRKEESFCKKETTGSKDVTSTINKFIKNEEESYKQLEQQMTIKLKPKEVNLRCYHSFSGVYHVDLVKHVSDLCQLKLGDFIQIHTDGLCQLQRENFVCDIPEIDCSETNDVFRMNCEYYFELNEQVEVNVDEKRKSSISSISSAKKTNTLETIIEPIKKQPAKKFHDSKNLVKLKIPLSQEVFWFMKPQPAVWDIEKKYWSVEHVCDVEHDKEHNMIEFKLGKLGPIAMFTFRFHELPYKNWTLSPDEEDEEIVLILEGQHLTTHLKIINDKICLKKIDGISEHLLDGIIGKMVDIRDLISKMKSVGLDIFPENDSFLYVKQCSAKPLSLEDHIYYTMAIFSNILEFKASSWNMAFGLKEIIFQFRLNTYHKTNPFQTLQCSNFGCEVLMLEDETDIFVNVTNNIIGHYPGPFSIFSKLFRNKINLLPEDLPKINAVYNILKKTKVLTYSGNPAKSL